MAKAKRTYHPKAERDRDLKMSNIEIKDHSYFANTDSVWNDTSRLQPSIAKYSADNISPNCFKKTVVDLNQVKKDELDA